MKIKVKGKWYDILGIEVGNGDSSILNRTDEQDIEAFEANGKIFSPTSRFATPQVETKGNAATETDSSNEEGIQCGAHLIGNEIPDLIPSAPDIDWEQRTWEAFLRMYNPNDSYEADSTLEKAKSVVNAYREKTQL
jgi:hypothetical protein